ncbi:uncharacterized protein A4U43_C04F14570 [Asparagus officinalis]|uniref:FCP1 homology domain-containing protein n=1 Tax=Asparagus officinalis TaxID=4686 RepID=A0A5P1F0U7_ASPOF|nr:CTD small phosphatase-like protein 2 isoform X2 [Asparagus officinalis]ONK71996.1 uncharacterized protein A4U43_C04F14570 [Asparagus officinalis]
MPTRKKIVTRNGAQELASPKLCRQQKKLTLITEKKVKELITSARKQKSVGLRLTKVIDAEETRDLNTTFRLAQDEVVYGTSHDEERSKERPSDCVPDTIFSPTYHHPKDHLKDDCGVANDKDFMKFFKPDSYSDQYIHASEESKPDVLNSQDVLENQPDYMETETEVTVTCKFDRNADSTSRQSERSDAQENDARVTCTESKQTNKSYDDKYRVMGNLSSEVSAIYLAMQHSKLECVDEQSQDSISSEGCVEQDDSDDFDDFDPYTFIKDLPDLSAVVPKFRPVLLPKQTRSCPLTTLVLDLDETLVHSSLEPCDADFTFPVNFNFREHTIYVRCRPYLKDFMERVAGVFEIIIFTASQSIYAEQLLNILDPKRRVFRHRVYREACVFVDGNYLKDLSVLGRDLSRVIIVDNSPQAFGFQLENGIPIESWFDDRNDQELLLLLPFLESLVGVDDVRPIIAKKFNLREKVVASSGLSLDFGR